MLCLLSNITIKTSKYKTIEPKIIPFDNNFQFEFLESTDKNGNKILYNKEWLKSGTQEYKTIEPKTISFEDGKEQKYLESTDKDENKILYNLWNIIIKTTEYKTISLKTFDDQIIMTNFDKNTKFYDTKLQPIPEYTIDGLYIKKGKKKWFLDSIKIASDINVWKRVIGKNTEFYDDKANKLEYKEDDLYIKKDTNNWYLLSDPTKRIESTTPIQTINTWPTKLFMATIKEKNIYYNSNLAIASFVQIHSKKIFIGASVASVSIIALITALIFIIKKRRK